MAELKYPRFRVPMARQRDVEGMKSVGPTVFNKLFGSARAAIRSKHEANRQALRKWYSGDGDRKQLEWALKQEDRFEAEELQKLEERQRREAEEERQRRGDEQERLRRKTEEERRRKAAEDARRREMADPHYEDRRAIIDRYRAIEKRRSGHRQGLAPPFDFWLDDSEIDKLGKDGGDLNRAAVDRMIGDPDYYDPTSPRGVRLRRAAADWFKRNAG